MRLERGSLIVNDSLSLGDRLHVVLHLVVKVFLEEANQVVLDVHLLNLTVNCLQLVVDLRGVHLAKTTQLLFHFGQGVFLLVAAVLLCLLLDICQDLRLDEIELNVDFEQTAIFFDKKGENVTRLFSECVAAKVELF